VQCIFEPTLVDFPEQNVDSVKAGYAHTVILSNGKVWTSGLNNFGQLGLDDQKARHTFHPLIYDINRITLP